MPFTQFERRAAVPTDPHAPVGAPLYPPRSWFDKPSWLEPGRKISVITEGEEAGRVAGYVAPNGTCILSGSAKGECWSIPPSPSNYAAAMQGETVTMEGELIPTANIGGDINHAPLNMRNFQKVKDHYANTASRVMRGVYGHDDYGLWFAGALWPEVTHAGAALVRAAALSGDWRWREEIGAYDLAASQMVLNPGYPLVPQIASYAASLTDQHPVMIGGMGGPPLEESMPDEPVLTLTLTAPETAKLHRFLTGPDPEPQTAAASTCACGGHAAAVVVDGTPAPPNPVGPPASAAPGDQSAVSREEFLQLAARVEVLEAEAMDRQLEAMDAQFASLPEPLTVESLNA